MAEITASLVKELRDKTQAGMMEAKNALVDAKGDIDVAIRALREKHKNMTVKEGRTSSQGVVEAFVREGHKLGVLVEINSETDFVARNEEFVALARDMAKHAAEHPNSASVEQLLDATHAGTSEPAKNRVQAAFGLLRENIIFNRFVAFKAETGTVGSYVHLGGQIGVLVELTAEGDDAQRLAREIAMHIASQKPKFLTRSEVPEAVIDEERAIVAKRTADDPKNASKPAEIIAKIVEGGLGSYFKENVLLEQAYIRDPKLTIEQVIKGKTEIKRFARYAVGEASTNA